MIDELPQRAGRILREESPAALLRKGLAFLYARLWGHLPRSRAYVRLNGVPVSHRRLTDRVLPGWMQRGIPTTDPDYERDYVHLIEERVSEGDDVVLVGGGWGVSTVAAARQVSESGTVTTFEGAERSVERVRRTVEMNGVATRVDVRHAVVGTDIGLDSSPGTARRVAPVELPACDVLALDCDGAELDIVAEMRGRSPTLIVEHHGMTKLDETLVEYQPERMGELIEEAGYGIEKLISDGDDECTYFVANSGRASAIDPGRVPSA